MLTNETSASVEVVYSQEGSMALSPWKIGRLVQIEDHRSVDTALVLDGFDVEVKMIQLM